MLLMVLYIQGILRLLPINLYLKYFCIRVSEIFESNMHFQREWKFRK